MSLPSLDIIFTVYPPHSTWQREASRLSRNVHFIRHVGVSSPNSDLKCNETQRVFLEMSVWCLWYSELIGILLACEPGLNLALCRLIWPNKGFFSKLIIYEDRLFSISPSPIPTNSARPWVLQLCHLLKFQPQQLMSLTVILMSVKWQTISSWKWWIAIWNRNSPSTMTARVYFPVTSICM